MMLAEHEKNGVKMHMSRKFTEIKGSDGKASSVVLDDGTEIESTRTIMTSLMICLK